ncbi:hypothetical protein JXB28_00830 [Candidatus Woesearchaeota archaeon]|nr:hypothetical protein [Candidatus Woesearchaeota archaeon]
MKKAMATGFLLAGIMMIVLILLFAMLLFKVKSKALQVLDDSECKGSIASHMMLLRATGEAMVTDIYCPTKYYTIPRERDNEVMHHLAESMKACWSTWGEGQLDLFAGEGKYCAICSVIDFEEKGKTINGFDSYLKNTPYKEGATASYLQYLSGFASDQADPETLSALQELPLLDNIDTSLSYANVFVYIKGESAVKEFYDSLAPKGTGTIGGGVATGLLIGAVIAVGAAVVIITAPISVPVAAVGGAAGAYASIGSATLVVGAIGTATKTAVVVTAVSTAINYEIARRVSDNIYWTSHILFVPYNAESLKQIGCKITPVKQERKDAVT